MKRVRLKRGQYDGMLRTRHEFTGPSYTAGSGDFGLCDNDLREYFNIPESCREVDLILSVKEYKDSYGVRQDGNEYIEVEGLDERVWVDDELVELVSMYASEVGRLGRYVYLSFEVIV
jgi:hypothetical protein